MVWWKLRNRRSAIKEKVIHTEIDDKKKDETYYGRVISAPILLHDLDNTYVCCDIIQGKGE